MEARTKTESRLPRRLPTCSSRQTVNLASDTTIYHPTLPSTTSPSPNGFSSMKYYLFNHWFTIFYYVFSTSPSPCTTPSIGWTPTGAAITPVLSPNTFSHVLSARNVIYLSWITSLKRRSSDMFSVMYSHTQAWKSKDQASSNPEANGSGFDVTPAPSSRSSMSRKAIHKLHTKEPVRSRCYRRSNMCRWQKTQTEWLGIWWAESQKKAIRFFWKRQ